MKNIETLDNFAQMIAELLRTDRYALIVCTGDTGEGKSCIMSQLGQKVAEQSKTIFSYDDSMTFRRDELKTWVDGDKEGNHQKEEYSVILADELISMFFKRNWFDNEQIDGIELLNKCRDRHLCILGNIPNFWDLDSAMYPLITFWIHVHERGIAWVFRKDRNPFTPDKWHKRDNQKLFGKHKHPYRCNGYVCTLPFKNWSFEDKKKYYAVRNKKRKRTEGQRGQKIERYGNIKGQRDELLKLCFKLKPKLKIREVSEVCGLAKESVRLIKLGLR